MGRAKSLAFFMIDISLDKSRAVRIKARVNESSVPQLFVFTNADGSAHDISSYNFSLIVQKRANSSVKLFTLTIGNGLTVQGADNNELLIEVTAARATQTADTYFWRLYSADEDHTWLNGPWQFHNGEHDAVVEETPIVIKANGDEITIEITGPQSTSSAIVLNLRADYDASGDIFPPAGTGSGTAGAIKRWDTYPILIGGYLDFGDGPEFVPPKSLLIAWADGGTEWRLL
jgi:hypothetical protein